MTGSKNDPVTSAFFAEIKFFICFFQNRINIAVEIILHQSVGQCDRKNFRAAIKNERLDFLPKNFQCRTCFIAIHVGEDQKKFFPAPAGDKGIGRQPFPESV